MLNIYSCNSLTEAYQKQYKFALHKRRLSEISQTNQKQNEDLSYLHIKLKLAKNKLIRKQFNDQEKNDSLLKSKHLFYSRLTSKSRIAPITFLSLPPSPRRLDPCITLSNKIFTENTKILPRLIFPKVKFPLNPCAKKQISEYNNSRKYMELSQKTKQPWKQKLIKKFNKNNQQNTGLSILLFNDKSWKKDKNE